MALDERGGLFSSTREVVDARERKRWLLALLIVGLIGAALRWGSLEVGQLSDDYIHHGMIAGLYPGEGYVPFDLYAFVRNAELVAHVEAGTVPWFAEPEFKTAVFRPLSSLLLWLDHTLAPRNLRVWHVHSLGWFVAVVVGFGLCVRRLLPRGPAALAVALLVCDASFVSPLGWLANRCVIVSAAFGFAAIYVHLEWRRPEPSTPASLRRAGPAIELALLAASLAAGEYGLGIVAYLLAWELLVGGRDATHPADGWAVRARALWPAMLAALSYLALHRLLGYGTFGADVYVDPLHAPRGWLRWANYRLPKLGAGAFWSVPASSIEVFHHPGAAWWHELWPAHDPFEVHRSHRRFGLVGIALAAVGLALARPGLDPCERRSLRAVVLGAALGLLPVSVAPAHSRLLVVAQLGACVSVSLLMFACARLLLDWRERGGGLTLARLCGLGLLPFVAALALLHTHWDLQWSQRYTRHLAGMAEANKLAYSEGDLLAQELDGREVIVLNGPSQSTGMYGRFVLDFHGRPIPASWRPLALGSDHSMFAYRPAADTLELAAIQGGWLHTAGELFFRRADELLPTGSKLSYPGLDVEVLADHGGHPTKIRVRFPHSLDDPRYLFLTSTQAGLNVWTVPPIRGSRVVPLPAMPIPKHLLSSEPVAGPPPTRP
jgi:hypothetical protein